MALPFSCCCCYDIYVFLCGDGVLEWIRGYYTNSSLNTARYTVLLIADILSHDDLLITTKSHLYLGYIRMSLISKNVIDMDCYTLNSTIKTYVCLFVSIIKWNDKNKWYVTFITYIHSNNI